MIIAIGATITARVRERIVRGPPCRLARPVFGDGHAPICVARPYGAAAQSVAPCIDLQLVACIVCIRNPVTGIRIRKVARRHVRVHGDGVFSRSCGWVKQISTRLLHAAAAAIPRARTFSAAEAPSFVTRVDCRVGRCTGIAMEANCLQCPLKRIFSYPSLSVTDTESEARRRKRPQGLACIRILRILTVIQEQRRNRR